MSRLIEAILNVIAFPFALIWAIGFMTRTKGAEMESKARRWMKAKGVRI